MTSFRTPRRFEIWLARVYFKDKPNVVKQRPVVVIDTRESSATVAKVTSHTPRDDFEGEVAIENWQEAGLLKPSTIRCSQVYELNYSELLKDKPFGMLQREDRERLTEQLYDLGIIASEKND
jgi:mRNA-degrading endonuclease toxin of MazEF toxin-antitoxin module